MAFETIICEKKENVSWITLNRPEVLNAASDTLRAELKTALEQDKIDNDVHIIVITGAGNKAFSAGADINAFTSLNSADALTHFKVTTGPSAVVKDIIKPVIAMVNGLALGGGCELALACDMIVASENARFGLPEVGVGVIPGGGGTQMLTKLVGEKKAKEIILTGTFISAKEAMKIGMVNKVVPQEELKEAVEKLIAKLKTKSPIILKIAKMAINKALETQLSVGWQMEKELFSMCFGTEDQKEGAKAFLEKRKPAYKGR